MKRTDPNGANKRNNAQRRRRTTLITVATLVGVAAIAVLTAILLSDGRGEARPKPEPTPTPAFTPFVPAESLSDTVDMLKGSMWRDRYDANYQLRFDKLLSSATETNSFTGNSRVFSITSSDESLYLVEGQARYMFYVSEGTLYLDYGDPVGVVEYLLVPTENG